MNKNNKNCIKIKTEIKSGSDHILGGAGSYYNLTIKHFR